MHSMPTMNDDALLELLLAQSGGMPPMAGMPPMGGMGGKPPMRDPRLPPPGTVMPKGPELPAMGPVPSDPESIQRWIQLLQLLPPGPGAMPPNMIPPAGMPAGPGMQDADLLPLLLRGMPRSAATSGF